MSSQATGGDDSGEYPSLKELAWQTLVDEYGESQNRRRTGYVRTQSLKKVVDALDNPGEQVQYVKGKRRADTQRQDLFGGEQSLPYLDATQVSRDEWTVSFDRAIHPRFDWQTLTERLSERPAVWDFPIERIVIQLRDDELYDHWVTFIEEASRRHPAFSGPLPTGWISQPFFAVMETSQPGTKGCRDNIERFHEDEPYYFMPRSQGDDTHSGMGWSPRSLDLTAIWSYRAFVDKGDVIAQTKKPTALLTCDEGETKRLTPRVIETELINGTDDEKREYGAVNALLSINKWRRAFGSGATGLKPFHWDERGEWVQNGGDGP